MYFNSTYTPEELYTSYRYWAKKLHPDKPEGDKVAFQQMQNEYESMKETLRFFESKNTMPNEYHRRKVRYAGVYFNHYYKFTQDYWADILVDIDHVNLIFNKRFAI